MVVSNHEEDGPQTVHPVMQCLSFVSILHHSTWSKRVALRYSLVLVTCRSIMWFWYIFPFKTWAPVLTAFSTSLVDSSCCWHRKVIDFPSPAFIKTTLRRNVKENNLPSKIRSTEARENWESIKMTFFDTPSFTVFISLYGCKHLQGKKVAEQ